jgi:site-specific DNA-methyltransferase (adenine-specific)
VDISKAIDKMKGAEREVVGKGSSGKTAIWQEQGGMGNFDITIPSTSEAKQWQGWGTALKPAMELFTLARKPFKSTVDVNVLVWGTGGLNIDGCRVGTEHFTQEDGSYDNGNNVAFGNVKRTPKEYDGRFPANFIHDGSEEVVALFPNENDESASRFFYTAKASQSERNDGLWGFEERAITDGRETPIDNAFNRGMTEKRNIHPTVKPLDLMRYLCRMITPKGGVVLDPFLGSGTTAIAAKQEKMQYIGMEIEPKYVAIAEARIKAAVVEYDIFDFLGNENEVSAR